MKIVNKETHQAYCEIVTNRLLTINEALYALGIDVENQTDIDQARGKYDFIFNDDEGVNRIDYDMLEMTY